MPVEPFVVLSMSVVVVVWSVADSAWVVVCFPPSEISGFGFPHEETLNITETSKTPAVSLFKIIFKVNPPAK